MITYLNVLVTTKTCKSDLFYILRNRSTGHYKRRILSKQLLKRIKFPLLQNKTFKVCGNEKAFNIKEK